MKEPAQNTPSDEQLIRDAMKGDHGAFTKLVQRYEDTVFRFSFKVCRDKEEAREALQDTFVNVYRNLGSFKKQSKFSTWLYSIVTNNCLMKRRKRKLDAILESLDDPPFEGTAASRDYPAARDDTPVDALMKKEFQSHLDSAILKLPVEYRLVFVLRDLEGKSTGETARILKISGEAAKSRLRRARAFLREQLSGYMERTTE